MAIVSLKDVKSVDIDLERSNERYILTKINLKKTSYRLVYIYDSVSRLAKGFEFSKIYMPKGVKVLDFYKANDGVVYYVTTVEDNNILLTVHNKRRLYVNEKEFANELNCNRDFLEKLVKKAMVETML